MAMLICDCVPDMLVSLHSSCAADKYMGTACSHMLSGLHRARRLHAKAWLEASRQRMLLSLVMLTAPPS